MKLGADPKRIAILSVLAVVGAYVLWTNVFAKPDDAGSPKIASVRAPVPSPVVAVHNASSSSDAPLRRREGQNRSADWNPPYKQPGVTIDPVKVDPTLRLDILAKVQRVEIEPDAQRNLFQFGAAPKPVDTTPLPPVRPIIVGGPHPNSTPVAPTGPPPDPVAPPITLKYYGFASPRASGHKRAFFLDNDDIIVAGEGELIKRRYKLVKIGVNSVTMEDTQFKSQQTLPLAPEAAT